MWCGDGELKWHGRWFTAVGREASIPGRTNRVCLSERIPQRAFSGKIPEFLNGCVSFQLKASAELVEARAGRTTTTSTGSVSVTITNSFETHPFSITKICAKKRMKTACHIQPKKQKRIRKQLSKLVYLFEEGNRNMSAILGGEGAYLAEMSNAGLLVPPGFLPI